MVGKKVLYKSPNDIPFKLSTLHAISGRFIFLQIYLNGHSLDTGPQKNTPKNGVSVFILLHIYANLWLKIPKFGRSKIMSNFLTCQKLPLYGPANGQSVTYSKIRIKVSRTP